MGLNFIRPFLAKAMTMKTYPCSSGLTKRFHCNREVTKQLSSSNDFSYLKGRHEGRSSENKTETHEERQLV